MCVEFIIINHIRGEINLWWNSPDVACTLIETILDIFISEIKNV